MSHDMTLGKSEPGPPEAEHPVDGLSWAWATEYGQPERASTEQLLSWLARGELPPHTLVWKPGWGEWLPAMQVAELAPAFPSVTPGSLRVARLARAHSDTPPPVPVAEYPRLRLLAKDVVGPSTLTPFTVASPGVALVPAERRSLRDLDRVQQDLVTSQIPAAKMLEAARAMKRMGPAVAPAEPLPLVRPRFDAAAREPESAQPRRGLRRHGPWLAFGALLGGALGLFAVRDAPAPLEAPVASVAVQAAVPSRSSVPVVVGQCRPSGDAVRLDERASRDVPLTITTLSGPLKLEGANPGSELNAAPGSVAVAYARNPREAAGVVLSESLHVDRLFTSRAARSLFSVTPMVRDGVLSFHAERQGSSVAFARPLDAGLSLRIGMNADGFVAGPLNDWAEPVWALPPGRVISVPAIAAHPGGYTVAAHLGRKHGPLRVGVLNERGEAVSTFAQIGPSDARFGRPALASGAGTTVLAAAALSREGNEQSLWLARADAGQPPLIVQPFDISAAEPIGGGRADLDTPALAALPGGGFALSFTQGEGHRRRVRLQRLSPELAPLDAPVDVTTPDPALRGASAAGLHWVKDRLLAFYFLGQGASVSVWASSVECELR